MLKLTDEKSRLQVAEHALDELAHRLDAIPKGAPARAELLAVYKPIPVRGLWLTFREVAALVNGCEIDGTPPNPTWGDAR